MTSASTVEASDTRAVEVHVDRSSLKLSGWATRDPPDGSEDLIVKLVAGSVLLGRLRQDRVRPDRLDSDATMKVGFELPDFGLAAFARMTGLKDIAVTVDGASAAAIEQEGPTFSPLGMRHGLGKALRLVDLWLDGSRNLSLRFEGQLTTAKTLDAYQCLNSKLVNVAIDRSLRGSDAIVTMSLINPFEPALLVFKGEDEAIEAIDFLPFPSLARGGLHAAERLIAAHGADDVADNAAIAHDLTAAWMERDADKSRCVTSIELDAATHTGLEPVLNRDLLNWMTSNLGIGVKLASGQSQSAFIAEMLPVDDGLPAATGHTLHLPADSIPTIAALLRPLPADAAAQSVTGGFGISEWNRHGRVWSVWQPPLPPELKAMQFAGAPQFAPSLTVQGKADNMGRSIALQWPLALAFREQPTRIVHSGPFEVAADRDEPLLRGGSVDELTKLSVLVLGASSAADPTRLLESLARQERIEFEQVLVCQSADAQDELHQALTRLFPDRYKLVPVAATAGRLEQIVAARDLLRSEKVLVVDATTIVPDARTIATLVPMLEVPDVASVGCLLRAATDKMAPISAGYSLNQIDLRAAPAVSFGAIDSAVWRAPCTYAVVANSTALVLIRSGLLGAVSPAGSTTMRPESDDLLLGMHLIAEGHLNLCTTLVSAYTAAPGRPSQTAISVPYAFGANELARIAQSSTIIQRVA